jgi:hypothetical protein
MNRGHALTLVGLLALTAVAESAPRRKRDTPRQDPRPAVQDQDEYRSCDVAVREFVHGRKEAAAFPVQAVKADALRMTLNFVHPFGESGETPPNLSFTRGESVEERRRALKETKQRAQVLADAAKTGNVWYVIAVNNEGLDSASARRSPASMQADDSRPSASASVFANLENRCISVYEFKTIPLDTLSQELRTLLGQTDRSPPTADNASRPPS